VDIHDEARIRALAPLGTYIWEIEQWMTPEGLINMWLVTQHIQGEGLSPQWDPDVRNLLWELTGGLLTDHIYDETRQAMGMSHQAVATLLARQIKWRQALERFDLSIRAISPATRWDWFQRLHRQVTIEAAAVPIDAFIDQVGTPTERQLNAFFNQHRTNRYNPTLAESGFIMPTELAFQYVVAAPTRRLLDSITEEEMLAFYEEHKDEWFRRPVTPITPIRELPQLPGMMPGLPGGGGGALPFPTPVRPTAPIMPVPTMPILPDLSDLFGDEGTQTEPTPNGTEQAEPPISDEIIEGETIEGTSAGASVMVRLVAYQTSETVEPVTHGFHERGGWFAETPQAVASEPTTDSIVHGFHERGGWFATAPQATEQGAAGEIIISPEEFAQMLEGLGTLVGLETEPVDLSILYIPFDDVKEQIRMELAMERAAAALPIILTEMRNYARIYNEHFEQGRPIPPMPDLTGFVADLGLELVTVPLGNIFAAMQTELARGAAERRHLVEKFHRIPLLFEGEILWGSHSQVLYWVTEERLELQPDRLDQVRNVVERRWKEVEARALALARAEELANVARTSDRSLAEVFAGRNDVPVVDTEPFTWKTYPAGLPPAVRQRVPPVFGEVRERGVVVGNSEFDNELIFAPGWGFMEAVYSLQVGEIGVVFNQPQTVAYIVRITSSSPSADVLWEQFQTTFVGFYLQAGRPEMRATAFEAWMDEIRSKTGFRWINRPDSRGMEWFGDDF